MDIKEKIKSLEKELIDIRRDIHMHPELGYQEFRTSKKVSDYLKKLGLEVETVSKTGVVGLLKGKYEGKTLMLRADMDALPQKEETNLPFKSVNKGVMHACGHDGHTAMLMVAAKLLSEYKERLKGNIKFVFQPNEEEAGALDMIKENVLENPKVDGAFGIHLWAPLKSGKVGLAEGPVMAALDEFELEIIGQSGHTGSPHTAIDPIIASTNIIQSIQSIQTREIDPLSPVAIMIGKVNGGTGRNVIADSVNIGGTIRYLFKDEEKERKELLEKFERVIKGTCMAMNVEYRLEFIPSNLALQNSNKLLSYARDAAIKTYEKEDIFEEYRSMAGEDFAEFSQRVPSIFYFLGVGDPEKGTDYPHHHSKFDIDEDILKMGVEIHVRTALDFLSNGKEDEE
ncbi:MAG TPA: amidohydrolase [Tissierellaceae bacterium]|nr:amidohydrolase [Tissierellaceae bacterium]